MISLPYDFDTASTWQRIIRIAATVLGALILSIVAAAVMRHWGAAVGLSLALLFFAFLLRIARMIPMGAAGQITRSEVICVPAMVFGYRMRVPVGKFPLAQFRAVTLEQRVIVMTPSGARSNEDVGSVCLVGSNGVPTIEIARTGIGAATILARELASTLALELREVSAPGAHIGKVQFGA